MWCTLVITNWRVICNTDSIGDWLIINRLCFVIVKCTCSCTELVCLFIFIFNKRTRCAGRRIFRACFIWIWLSIDYDEDVCTILIAITLVFVTVFISVPVFSVLIAVVFDSYISLFPCNHNTCIFIVLPCIITREVNNFIIRCSTVYFLSIQFTVIAILFTYNASACVKISSNRYTCKGTFFHAILFIIDRTTVIIIIIIIIFFTIISVTTTRNFVGIFTFCKLS